MKNILLLSALSCLFFWTCKPKEYTLDNLPEKKIVFSEGGGFTGAYTTWLLLDSGQLFEKTGFDGSYTEIGRMAKKEVKKYYQSADSLDLALFKKNEPGNFNYSLTLQRDSVKTEASWSNPNDIDADIVSFYKKLRKRAFGIKKENSENNNK